MDFLRTLKKPKHKLQVTVRARPASATGARLKRIVVAQERGAKQLPKAG